MSPRSNSPPRFSETRLRSRASTRGRVVVKGRRVCAERLLLNPVNLSCPLPPSQRRRPSVCTARPLRVGACGSWKRVGSRRRVSRGMVDVAVSEGRGRNGEAARPLGIAVDGACGKGEHGSLRCHGKAGGGSVGRWSPRIDRLDPALGCDRFGHPAPTSRLGWWSAVPECSYSPTPGRHQP